MIVHSTSSCALSPCEMSKSQSSVAVPRCKIGALLPDVNPRTLALSCTDAREKPLMMKDSLTYRRKLLSFSCSFASCDRDSIGNFPFASR